MLSAAGQEGKRSLGAQAAVVSVVGAGIAIETPLIFKDVSSLASQSLAQVLADAAYELTAWDIKDRGLAPDARTHHDARAQMSRERIHALASQLEIAKQDLVLLDLGTRQSRSNGGRFPLRGFSGSLIVAGDCHALRPWLQAAAFTGLGQRRALGFGRISLQPCPQGSTDPARVGLSGMWPQREGVFFVPPSRV